MSDKQIIVKGNYYEQSGNLGTGHVSESEIKGEAKLGGIINKREENTKTAPQEIDQNKATNDSSQSESSFNNEHNQEKQHEMTFVFTGTLTADSEIEFNGKKTKIKVLIQHLEKFCDGELTILDTSKGSVRLRLGGSSEDLEKLQELFNSGELNEVLGIPVQDVQLITTENNDDDEKIETYKKSRLIEEIVTQDAEGQDLSDAKEERFITNLLVCYLAELLEIEPDEIDVTIPFDLYGLDSSATVAMTGDLEELLGHELDPILIYDYPTIKALARYLSERQSHKKKQEPTKLLASDVNQIANEQKTTLDV